MSFFREFIKGLWRENPVLVLMLGMCPTLAVSSSAKNALGMGIATTFVLFGSKSRLFFSFFTSFIFGAFLLTF